MIYKYNLSLYYDITFVACSSRNSSSAKTFNPNTPRGSVSRYRTLVIIGGFDVVDENRSISSIDDFCVRCICDKNV